MQRSKQLQWKGGRYTHTARTAYHLLLMLVGWTSHSSVRIWHVLVNVALDHTARAARADLTSVWLDWVEVRPAGRPLYFLSAYSFWRKSVMTPTLWGPALLSWGMGLSPRLWRYVTATCCRFLCGCVTALWWASIETSLVLPADRDATQWIGPLLYQSDYHRHISPLSP